MANPALARLSYVPVAAFALAIPVLWVAGPHHAHESGPLLFALNWTLTALVCLFIAVLAGRSFLLSAEPGALMLCCAMMIWGSSAAIAVTGSHVGNYNITIHNLGMCLAALCHLVGAFLVRHSRVNQEPGGILALAIAGSLISVGLIWMAALEDWLPVFFVQGQGGTAVRDIVMLLSIAMYGATSILMWRNYRQISSEFLRWYALGLALLSIGAIGLALQTVHGSELSWTARAAQYCAGFYMLVGAVFSMRESRGGRLPLAIALEQAMVDYELLFQSINDGIMLHEVDAELRPVKLMRANDVLCQLLGYSREECDKLHPLHIFSPDHRNVLPGVDGLSQERMLLTKDGRRIPAEISARVFDYRGKRMVLSVIRNVTQRKMAEESLKNADRRKDEFLAILAHELRNPLAPMRHSLEIMKRAQGNLLLIERARATVERQLSHMVRLVDDLLDVSRFSRGHIELRKERFDLASVVQDAIETSRPMIESQNIVLSVLLPSKPSLVEADRVRLTQVFSNLLSNAVKYGNRGGRIELRGEHRDGMVEVAIKDDGIGIPAPMLPNVFDLFVQGDQSIERSKGGLGIGLTLVKWLVELHGGSVTVRSEVGVGSEFIVRLPLALSLVPKQESRTDNSANLQPRRIVVADDNSDAAASLAVLLKMMGHDVRTANNGFQAIDIAQSFQPHLVFLDIGMPDLNGYDACRRIRAQEGSKDILLIALTGWGQESDRAKAKDAGFDEHVVKPVEISRLIKLLGLSTEKYLAANERPSS